MPNWLEALGRLAPSRRDVEQHLRTWNELKYHSDGIPPWGIGANGPLRGAFALLTVASGLTARRIVGTGNYNTSKRAEQITAAERHPSHPRPTSSSMPAPHGPWAAVPTPMLFPMQMRAFIPAYCTWRMAAAAQSTTCWTPSLQTWKRACSGLWWRSCSTRSAAAWCRP